MSKLHMNNEIVDVSYETWEMDDGPDIAVLLIACNLFDPESAADYIEQELCSLVRRELMLNPGTQRIYATSTGQASAELFRQAWQTRVSKDQLFAAQIQSLEVAEITWGNSKGDILDEASLL